MDAKKIIGIVAVICVLIVALFYMGIIHTGFFAIPGTTYGPGTYVVGSDIPAGIYDLETPYSVQGTAIFSASSNGGMSISDNGVQLMPNAVVTIEDGGSMKYVGS